MVFNDTTNLSGAIQSCESWLFGSNYGSISGDTLTLKQFTKLINDACDVTSLEILKADAKWQYDSSSYTDLPEATTELSNGESNYTLLGTHLIVRGVEIKLLDGRYVPIKQIDYIDVRQSGNTESDLYQEDGLPIFYDIKGDQLVLLPAPSEDVVDTSEDNNSLKLIFQRNESYFSHSDTTKTFGFPIFFHQLPVLIACSTYAKQNDMSTKARELDAEIKKISDDMKSFMNTRNKDVKKRIRPAYRSSK